MAVRGIRGATTVDEDTPEAVLEATRELLQALLERNGITSYDDIVSVIFTTTSDLTSAFPAEAARAVGMDQVPLLCAAEIPVPGSMPRCIRVLMLWNTDRRQDQIVHVYLRDAQKLRPDMTKPQ